LESCGSFWSIGIEVIEVVVEGFVLAEVADKHLFTPKADFLENVSEHLPSRPDERLSVCVLEPARSFTYHRDAMLGGFCGENVRNRPSPCGIGGSDL
jgi:hypothetical protein